MEFNATKESILARVSLTDLIGETVRLKRGHGRALGLCPFHEESTPSFNVYDDRFYCFGCKASGDAIEFVRKQQGLGFIEALQYLGNKYGVDTSGLVRKKPSHHKNHTQAMQLAHDYYRQCLASPVGKQALTYLESRKVSAEDIRTYGLGYAPADGAALARYLHQHKVKTQDAQAVSLMSYRRDFFRDRLMFPIHDIKGAVVGFAGRSLAKDNKIKYLNSRDNALFHKKKTLFGLAAALQAIADKKSVIVVEGYFDWLRLHKAGITNTVCCMGTAFSEQHLKSIKRYISEVVLLFDGDNAGTEAAAQAVSLVYAAPNIEFNVCQLPAGEDPDSYVLRVGSDATLAYLQEKRTPVSDFFITHKFKNNRPEHYLQVMSNEILPFLRMIRSGMEKDLIISKVATASNISVEQIKLELQQQRKPEYSKANSSQQFDKLSALQEEFCGHLYYADPDEVRLKEVADFAVNLRLAPSYMEFISYMLSNLRAGNKNSDHDFTDIAPDVASLVDKIKRNEKAYSHPNHYDAIQVIIKAMHLRKTRSNISMLHTKINNDNLHVLGEIRTLKQHSDKMHQECFSQGDKE